MPVHVSIHDVSPAARDEVELALELCHARRIKPALLVVPDFHHQAPLLGDEPFCARLRDLQSEGHEIYLHGFFHQSGATFDRASGRKKLGWLVSQRVVSGGEAEMNDISESEGKRRIEEGERVFASAGLRIDGFIAPAWSMPRWLLPLLRVRRYRFTEDHFRVHDPFAQRSRPSVVLNWATRSPGRLLSTVAYCRAARIARALLPARIAIHPHDMRYRLVRSEVIDFLRWAEGDIMPRAAEFFR